MSFLNYFWLWYFISFVFRSGWWCHFLLHVHVSMCFLFYFGKTVSFWIISHILSGFPPASLFSRRSLRFTCVSLFFFIPVFHSFSSLLCSHFICFPSCLFSFVFLRFLNFLSLLPELFFAYQLLSKLVFFLLLAVFVSLLCKSWQTVGKSDRLLSALLSQTLFVRFLLNLSIVPRGQIQMMLVFCFSSTVDLQLRSRLCWVLITNVSVRGSETAGKYVTRTFS